MGFLELRGPGGRLLSSEVFCCMYRCWRGRSDLENEWTLLMDRSRVSSCPNASIGLTFFGQVLNLNMTVLVYAKIGLVVMCPSTSTGLLRTYLPK